MGRRRKMRSVKVPEGQTEKEEDEKLVKMEESPDGKENRGLVQGKL